MIRPVAHSDTERLLRLWLDTFQHAHPSLPESYWAQQESRVRNWCKCVGAGWVYCAQDKKRPDGFVLISNSGELLVLFISRAQQGRGAGSALLAEAAQKHPQLWLAVLEENLGARYFFQTHGFVEQDRHYMADAGQHVLQMEVTPLRATGS